jgi:hypothetical protein
MIAMVRPVSPSITERDTGQPFAARHAMTAAAMVAAYPEPGTGQLRQEDHDGQAVDEAQHHRMRHQPDELAKFEDARPS